MSENKKPLVIESAEQFWRPDTRRGFLRQLAIGGSVVLLPSVFAACRDGDDNNNGGTTGPGGTTTGATLNLSTDVGILNYAFALEQLEAAFYTAVLASTTFATMSGEQREVFTDLRNHEVVHREFLRQVLGTAGVGNLAFNQTAVGNATANLTSIMRNAEAFEDLGVAAYNGAGKYLSSGDNLLVAGKIVSVEARHAAAIRDMREAMGISAGTPANTRFAGDDVVNSQGLDVKLEPGAVLTRVGASGTVTTTISIGTQPTRTQATGDFGPPSPTP